MAKGSINKNYIEAYIRPIIYHLPATLRRRVTLNSWPFCMLFFWGQMKMTKKTIVGKYCTKKMETLMFDLSEAILKYYKGGTGTVNIDDIDIDIQPINNAWVKMEFWFKVVN